MRSRTHWLRHVHATRDALYQAYQAAAEDPEYVREMEELTADFDVTVGDGLEDEPGDDAFTLPKRSPQRRTS